MAFRYSVPQHSGRPSRELKPKFLVSVTAAGKLVDWVDPSAKSILNGSAVIKPTPRGQTLAMTPGGLGNASLPTSPRYDLLSDFALVWCGVINNFSQYNFLISRAAGGGANQNPFELRTDAINGSITLTRADDYGYVAIQTVKAPPLGVPVCIVISLDKEISAYINGELVYLNAATMPTSINVEALQFGTRGDNFAYADVSMDLAAGFDRALDRETVKRISRNPSLLFAPTSSRIFAPASAAGGTFTGSNAEAMTLADAQTALSAFTTSLPEAVTLTTQQDALLGFAVTAPEAMGLGDTLVNRFSVTANAAESMAFDDATSNVAALSASINEAISFSANESNGSGLAANQSEAMTLADSESNTAALSVNATDAMGLADSISNGAGLLASAAEAMVLTDSRSGLFAVTAFISEAMTLVDFDSLQAGNYLASVNEALVMVANSDSSKASAAMQIEAMTLADAASQGGSYVASPTVYGSPARLSSYNSPDRLSSYSSAVRQ